MPEELDTSHAMPSRSGGVGTTRRVAAPAQPQQRGATTSPDSTAEPPPAHVVDPTGAGDAFDAGALVA
ncbi:hypothetical protein [Pseudonocardia humida]|uniref:Carbohydrate kinase PfkB domain-containing protein n=1 Tax=Pseudonocardia humida TaxID=2800819 RepID=A0ABT1A753_9PSEU|nr:hypothetical protein [Pseudonocardia humida]MCO1658862.1 hypothetical protein [Pseudonocardia humida]